MKAIIIDDELNGREILSTLIGKYIPDIQEVHLAKNAAEGIEKITQEEPDIVFLDIEMPNGSGFDMLESGRLINKHFHLIFTTAYEEYGWKAFRYKALDYLLKPINLDDLKRAIERCKENQLEKTDYQQLASQLKKAFQLKSKFTLTSREGFEVINVSDIIYCKSEANYTRFFLLDGSKRFISKTMKTYQSILEENGFLRIHKSYIINLNLVTNYVHGKPAYVKMSNGDYLEISKTKKALLLDVLVNG